MTLRILHVFDHSLPLQSGYVSRSLGILRSQRARGWETVQVTAPRHAAWTRQEHDVENFGELSFHRSKPPALHLPLVYPVAEMMSLRRRIAEVAARERPHVIHVHSPILNVIPALSVARGLRVPLVYEVRAFWEDAAVDLGRSSEGSARYRATRALDTWAMRRVDAVLPLCEPMRAELLQRGIPARKLTVVPNAVDERFLAPPPNTGRDIRKELGLEHRFVIGFIGSFYSYEGLDLALEAMSLLRNAGTQQFSLLLVGGGHEEARLRAVAAKLGLDDVVRFVARVPHEDVPRYYDAADLFVFPRRRMRLTELVTPLKPLEAMAQRKPVAASDVGGHRELVRGNETGYLFPADDATALAHAIAAIAADPSGAARIAAKGREFVEMHRTWTAISARYAEVYEQLLGDGRAAA